jgi:hypothetical protein
MLVFGLCLNTVLACLDEGRVTVLKENKSVYTMRMESGREYTMIGKKHPLLPIVKNSIKYGRDICITNMTENYPIQIVAAFRDFDGPSIFSENCVKKSFIRKVYVNPKYNWFLLEDNFVLRVIHRSKVTPKLYEAAFAKKEVCITEMNLEATDGTWGIPRDLEIAP